MPSRTHAAGRLANDARGGTGSGAAAVKTGTATELDTSQPPCLPATLWSQVFLHRAARRGPRV